MEPEPTTPDACHTTARLTALRWAAIRAALRGDKGPSRNVAFSEEVLAGWDE